MTRRRRQRNVREGLSSRPWCYIILAWCGLVLLRRPEDVVVSAFTCTSSRSSTLTVSQYPHFRPRSLHDVTARKSHPPELVEEAEENDGGSPPFADAATGGPFEAMFPRYRIDFQPLPQESQPTKNAIVERMKPTALREWQQQAQIRQLEKRYPHCRIVTVPTVSSASASVASTSSSTTASATTTTNNMLQNAQTMTTVWQSVADAVAQQQDTIVVVPNHDVRMASQCTDLLQWTLTHMPTGQGNTASTTTASPLLHVECAFEECAIRMMVSPPATKATATTLATASLSDDATTTINRRTQAWVKRVLVKMGICPFTKSVRQSGQGLGDVGVPTADIAYYASTATTALPLLADTWLALTTFLQVGPAQQSSILLAAPAYDTRFAEWAGPVFTALEASVVVAQVETAVGVVCFHPQYATPDGSTWPGFGHMHSVPRLLNWITAQRDAEETKRKKQQQRQQEISGGLDNDASSSSPSSLPTLLSRAEVAAGGSWQRRTPHATINVLRAEQLTAAESRRDSATLYPRNIRALMAIGNEALQAALDQERQL